MGPATIESAVRAGLTALAAEWRVPVVESQLATLERFSELLLAWSARINLTGARTAEALLHEHLPDAFAVASLLTEAAQVVDVGSGGGLPALPLAILRPALQLTLVEPLAKKVAFLRTAVRELGLATVKVEPRRVEAVHPASFDVAMSRATFPPDVWLPLALTLVRPGGRVLVLTVPGTDIPGRRVNYFNGRRTLIETISPACST